MIRLRFLSVFPGMLEKRAFHVTWGRPGHGVGDAAEVESDLVVLYDGKTATVARPKCRDTSG